MTPAAVGTSDTTRQRVLVVEDEQHLAEGLRFNLEEEGYAAEVVDTGEGALDRLLGGAHFDLVVLDVMLPGKDGFAVVGELREQKQFVPVLILTAARPIDTRLPAVRSISIRSSCASAIARCR
jgi:DNA-binding response OmpR family regulator